MTRAQLQHGLLAGVRRHGAVLLVSLAPTFLVGGGIVGAAATAQAEPEAASTTVGATSQRSARDEAIRSIPWKQLGDSQRRQLQSVIQNASMYRRLPTRVIDCDPDLFTFLLQHPEVVVDVWQMMGISKVTLQQTSASTYRGNDGCGTTGNVSYFYTNWGPDAQNLVVVYAEGAYDGKPFIKPLRARSAMVLQSGAVRETNGRSYITVRVDSFVEIQQMGVELVARTVQPWINQTADRNFIETLGFVSTFSQTAEKNPQGMQRLAAKLRTVDAPTRDELVHLCFRAAQRYAKDDTKPGDEPYVLAQRVDLPLSQTK
ncbi:MAG: hypothetical protein AB7G28_15210 [Pirellulales bacterium]